MKELKERLTDVINNECKYADKNGSTKMSTCSDPNWNQDVWNYKNEIVSAIEKRGYNVSCEVRWGVTDYTITPKIELV
jgi:hypothetical protein